MGQCILMWLLFKWSKYTFLIEELEKQEKAKRYEVQEDSTLPRSFLSLPLTVPLTEGVFWASVLFLPCMCCKFIELFSSAQVFPGVFKGETGDLLVGRQHEECLKENEMERFHPAVIFCTVRLYSPGRQGGHRCQQSGSPSLHSLFLFSR